MLFSTAMGHADDDLYYVSWLTDENIYITTSANANVYRTFEKTKYQQKFPEWYTFWKDFGRKTIDYTDYEKIIIKKPKTFKVRGYANFKKQFHYDTYVVEIKKGLYYLPAEYVEDNKNIELFNSELDQQYNNLLAKKDHYDKERDSLRNHYLLESQKSLLYNIELREELPKKIDSVERKVKSEFENYRKVEVEKWYNSLPNSTRRVYDNVLSLNSVTLHSPNSAGGCDCSVYYTNKSKKTIKYLYWNAYFYNAVNDLVSCDVSDDYSCTGKDTGPIAPNANGGGRWDCVIYNWSANSIKLSYINIVYTDGTQTRIEEADIKRLLTYSEVEEKLSIYGSEYQAIKKAKKEYEHQLSSVDKEIKKWEERIKWLEAKPINDCGYANNYFKLIKGETGEYKALLEKLNRICCEMSDQEKRIFSFKMDNFLWEYNYNYHE